MDVNKLKFVEECCKGHYHLITQEHIMAIHRENITETPRHYQLIFNKPGGIPFFAIRVEKCPISNILPRTIHTSKPVEIDKKDTQQILNVLHSLEGTVKQANTQITAIQAHISKMSQNIDEIENIVTSIENVQLKTSDCRPEITLNIANRLFNCLLDSGASVVCIDEKIFKLICEYDPEILNTIIPWEGNFNQASAKSPLKTICAASINFQFAALPKYLSSTVEISVVVIPDLNSGIILGRTFLDEFRIDILHPRREIVMSFPGEETSFVIPYVENVKSKARKLSNVPR